MFGLSEKIINEIQTVLSSFPQIEKALIYGSRAKGNYRDDSDIDVCLFGENLSAENTTKPLSAKLGSIDCLYEIDLTIYDKIDCSKVKKYVDDWGKIIYQKNKTKI